MSWISAITDSYRRFRHSKGFGVHSPFAYALITEALYPSRGYMYYLESDPRLESAAPADSRRTRALYAKGALILGGRTMTIAVRRSGMADIIYTLP